MVCSEGLDTWEGTAEVQVDGRLIEDVKLRRKLKHIKALKLLLQSTFTGLRWSILSNRPVHESGSKNAVMMALAIARAGVPVTGRYDVCCGITAQKLPRDCHSAVKREDVRWLT